MTQLDDLAIDVAQLDKTFNGDRKRIEWILNEFVRMSQEDMERIRRALASDDLKTVRDRSHSMAGAAAFVTAAEVADLGRQISELPAEVGPPQYAGLVEQLANALGDLENDVRRWLG